MEQIWEQVRTECAKFDINSTIKQALAVANRENVDPNIEILIRRHYSHTRNDSGIANARHRIGESAATSIFESATKVLEMTFEELVQKIDSSDYDVSNITEEALYKWHNFFHDGSELEAIHIAILMFAHGCACNKNLFFAEAWFQTTF